MGLFGKKKEAAADAPVSTSNKGKRDGLASVVDESVPELLSFLRLMTLLLSRLMERIST